MSAMPPAGTIHARHTCTTWASREAAVVRHYGCTDDEQRTLLRLFRADPPGWQTLIGALWREILDGSAGPPAAPHRDP